ncbi:hypothetical protein Rsub_02437 [Raphidocelis subcapitata]|uniref:Uncharacterized protein n=1 Tax=Raphidocelis subcapitata TaxID=307507 RepID=A0A2V0NRS0_9CHLO|nr:hypothetical protein Rsub_02437 [Raphidocelis subcapitata]|eukprot:GBF90331.1 hypothetical protein Rsub_02437 [Raphidocelis subcapitata]
MGSARQAACAALTVALALISCLTASARPLAGPLGGTDGPAAAARRLGELVWPGGPPTQTQMFTAALRQEAMAPFHGRQDYNSRIQPAYFRTPF